jgi:hypothetical protein
VRADEAVSDSRTRWGKTILECFPTNVTISPMERPTVPCNATTFAYLSLTCISTIFYELEIGTGIRIIHAHNQDDILVTETSIRNLIFTLSR